MPSRSRHSLLSESLFGEALIRSSIAAFLIRDESIIAVNEAACRLTGYSADELVSMSTHELAGARDPDQVAEARRRREAAERGEWQTGVGQVARKDGEIRPVQFAGGATAVGDVPTFLALAWETTAVDPGAARQAQEAEGEEAARREPAADVARRGARPEREARRPDRRRGDRSALSPARRRR